MYDAMGMGPSLISSESLTTSFLGIGRALIHLLDYQGRWLTVCDGVDLAFVRHATSASPGLRLVGQPWLLTAAAPGQYFLQHAGTRKYLGATSAALSFSCEPQQLQIYVTLDRCLAIRFSTNRCLQSAPDGTAVAGGLPLSQNRRTKLFQLQEVAAPLHALRSWPLRVLLRCQAAHCGYLSAAPGGGLTVTAPVACCSEAFVVGFGGAAPCRVQGSTLTVQGCSIWTADGTRMVSHAAGAGQLTVVDQHAAAGREGFTLQLSREGEVRLLAEQPVQLGQHPPAGLEPHLPMTPLPQPGKADCHTLWDDSSLQASLAPVLVRDGRLLASRGSGKPSKLRLELAGQPLLVVTAHGHLLTCSQGQERPCGRPLPSAAQQQAQSPKPAGTEPLPVADAVPPTSISGGTAQGRHVPASGVAHGTALSSATWLLQHHGDGVYSLRHGASGASLYVDDAGAPCMDSRGAVVHPDERRLFWMEPGWATLEAGAALPASHGGASTGATAFTSTCAAAAGFALPSQGSGDAVLTVAGFSIRTVRRVGGSHLYLTALPDGLVSTVRASGAAPSRWELFTLVDHQTLVSSPLQLADHLPRTPDSSQPQQPMQQPQPQLLQRTASLQAMSTCGASAAVSAAPGISQRVPELPRVASLPAVPEGHTPQLVADCSPPTSSKQLPLCPPRRCHSETRLAELRDRQGSRRLRWLAQLLRPEPPVAGWGVRSPAALQALACRQLCNSLLEQCERTCGGKGMFHTDLLDSLAYSCHLPDEVAASVRQDLNLLAGDPPASKLSMHALAKAALLAGGASEAATEQLVPAWAVPHLASILPDAGATAWHTSEAWLCCACQGGSGALLPLEPFINPAHHLFLTAMEQQARGGGRGVLRARRRYDAQDPMLAVLHAGKLAMLVWGVSKTLAALFLKNGDVKRRH